MEQAIINLFVGVVIAVISSLLSVRLTLNRFYSEKWFELRLKAYQEVIESLHYMKHFTEQQQRTKKSDPTSPEVIEQVRKAYDIGLDKLRKNVHMGSLLLSSESQNTIHKLIDDLDAGTQRDLWWENLDNEANALSQCLSDLVPLARKHLNA